MGTQRALALEPEVEATDPNAPARRAAAGQAAGREVRQDQQRLERDAVERLVRRLQQLKRELQGVIAGAATPFRRFTAQSLIAEIDRLIQDARGDITAPVQGVFNRALSLGAASVDQSIIGARISLTTAPSLDPELVTNAFALTADLLSEPMQQFRNQVVQRVRRAAVAGESGFAQMRELASSIDAAGLDNAMFRAERIVRTEMSRVLNQATFDRMADLADKLPFIRKGWRHSRDSRVRLGHREAGETYARGQGIPVRERFQVTVYRELPGKSPVRLGMATLRFPVDPETEPAGRIAAGATIMCRCGAFLDFALEDLRSFTTARTQIQAPEFPRGSAPLAPEPARPSRRPKPATPANTNVRIRRQPGPGGTGL